MTRARPSNLGTLRELLPDAERRGYAVGSFSPRYLRMVPFALAAAQEARSPAVIQISANELRWFETTPEQFAAAFFDALAGERITVPVALHLDHTKDPAVIERAIDAGFTSVMIDRSELPLEDNAAATRAVVALARGRGVSVEGELGRIFSADQMETAEDRELYTVPEEAATFCALTGVDALAVSVGTAHGVYNVRRPAIDFDRLAAIRRAVPAHLVLHGGSGVPADMVREAILLGVSKINIATDLEQAMLAALGLPGRTTNATLDALGGADLTRAGAAVAQVVIEKITHFLGSAGVTDDKSYPRKAP
jgi:fructose-bisphosphate aldolase class II